MGNVAADGVGETFDAGEVRIHFYDTGVPPAEASSESSPLVLLHAFPLSAQMWQQQRAALADARRVITPDQRGFGRSQFGLTDEPSLDRVADDVARLLDFLDLGSVILGGLSMGGYVAMAFLRRHPDRVNALALCDTKAGADPEAVRANRLRIAERVTLEGSAVLLEEVYPALVGESTKNSRPDVVAEVRELVAGATPDGASWAQRAMAARPDSLATLREVRVPTLIIRGDEDVLSTEADAEAMAVATGGEVVTLAGCGHLTALESSAAFTDVLRKWLAGLPA